MLNYNLNILGAANKPIVPIGETPTTTTTTTTTSTTTTSTTTTTTTSGSGIVQDGIVLWLDASEITSYPGSGSTWYDLSPTSENGTIYDATGAFTSSVSGGYFYFTSASQYVEVPHNTAFNVFDGDFTIDMWYTTDETGSAASGQDFFGVFAKPYINQNRDLLQGGVTYYVNRDSAQPGYKGSSVCFESIDYNAPSGGFVEVGQFVNVQLLRSGSTIQQYTNLTASLSTGSISADANTTSSIKIGRALGVSFIYEIAKGKIGFIALYDKALNESQRAQNYFTVKSRY